MKRVNLNILNDESGAVTVDWVVLTAAIITVGVATTVAINAQVGGISDNISTYLADIDVS